MSIEQRADIIVRTMMRQEYIYDREKVVALIKDDDIEAVAEALCIFGKFSPPSPNLGHYYDKGR